jgi:hypothetical protein
MNPGSKEALDGEGRHASCRACGERGTTKFLEEATLIRVEGNRKKENPPGAAGQGYFVSS